jgi:hypothetical protein
MLDGTSGGVMDNAMALLIIAALGFVTFAICIFLLFFVGRVTVTVFECVISWQERRRYRRDIERPVDDAESLIADLRQQCRDVEPVPASFTREGGYQWITVDSTPPNLPSSEAPCAAAPNLESGS